MKQELISSLSLFVTTILIILIFRHLSFDKGYSKGYEDAIERLYQIDKKPFPNDTGSTRRYIPDLVNTDTIVLVRKQ